MNIKTSAINLIRNNQYFYKVALKFYGILNKTKIKFVNNKICVQKNRKEISLNIKNISYVKEIVDFFDFYYNSVTVSEDSPKT